ISTNKAVATSRSSQFAKFMFIGVHPSPRSLSECGFVIEMITNHNSLITSYGKKWAVRVSNPRPSRCKRDALPLSYPPELPLKSDSEKNLQKDACPPSLHT